MAKGSACLQIDLEERACCLEFLCLNAYYRKFDTCGRGGTGRRAGLRSLLPQGSGSSILLVRTTFQFLRFFLALNFLLPQFETVAGAPLSALERFLVKQTRVSAERLPGQ